LSNITQTIEYRGVSHFAGYISTIDNTMCDPIKRLMRFFTMRKIPQGGLLPLHDSIVETFMPMDLTSSDQMLLTASLTYSKIFSEGGTREAFGFYDSMKVFSKMIQQLNQNMIREYFCNEKTNCIMSCIAFLRLNIEPETFYKKQLYIYRNLERHVRFNPLLNKYFMFRGQAYDVNAIARFEGIQVFSDHAIAISRTPVDSEFYRERKKKYEDYDHNFGSNYRFERGGENDSIHGERPLDRVAPVQRQGSHPGGASGHNKVHDFAGHFGGSRPLRNHTSRLPRQEEGRGGNGVDQDNWRERKRSYGGPGRWFGGESNANDDVQA